MVIRQRRTSTPSNAAAVGQDLEMNDDKLTDVAARAATKAGDRWPDAETAFAAGLEMRRAMFGSGGADDQIDAATDFTWPMQDFVTRYCFGETWTRSELPPNIRSMLTMAMLVAYGRPHELRVHVRGAIANGVTVDEIREVLLQAMIYCGVPRAVEGFRVAAETLREMGYDT